MERKTLTLVQQIEACARSPQFRINPSLIQMQQTLACNPHLVLRSPAIIIGGTNGKGTTAGYLFTLLHEQLNLKVGLYTSPHLHHFHERIQLSHVAVDDELLTQHWYELVATVRTDTPLSFFEWTTLLAFYVFNTYTTDINILEVGLGGKWDATNVVDPIAAVLVSLGKDHQRLLGNTYAQIFADKIAITRPQRPLFWGNQGSGADDPAAQTLLQQTATAKKLQLYRFGAEFHQQTTDLYWQGKKIFKLPSAIASAPSFLQKNFCLAAAVSHWYRTSHSIAVQSVAMPAAVKQLPANHLPSTLAARCQHLHIRDYEVITDACHNIDGALVFREYLCKHLLKHSYKHQGKLTGFVCLLADKDIADILAILATCLQPLYFFSVQNSRAASCSHLPAAYRKNFYVDFNHAWQAAQPCASIFTVCGSFYGLDAALTYLRVLRERTASTTIKCQRRGKQGSHKHSIAE